jgi:hypothetical protein
MKGLAWWPVTLILLAAPFGVWGWGWLDKQRVLAVHARQLAELGKGAAKERDQFYALGKRDGAALIRDAERTELEATKAELERMEAELEAERAKAAELEAKTAEAPPAGKAAAAPTPDIVELCRKSASCRERRGLK